MAKKSLKSKVTPNRSSKRTPATNTRSSSKKRAPAKTAQTPRRTSGSKITKSTTQTKSTPKPVRTGMSIDRKLDITGIVLSLVGLLTFLVMVSPIRSSVTEGWMTILGWGFGGGKYILPFLLIFGGLWLVFRKFNRIPTPAPDRILGFTLTFLCLLTAIHFVYINAIRPESNTYSIANEGLGGGYTGAALSQILISFLGVGGTAIILAAWMVIGIILALDLSVWDLVSWIPPYSDRFQDWIIEKTAQIRNNRKASQGISGYYPDTISTQTQPSYTDPQGTQTSVKPIFNPNTSGQRTWILPPIDQILESGTLVEIDGNIDRERALLIEDTLSSFGAPGKVVETNRGPTITQFGIEPLFIETRSGRTRVRVSKIAGLADDLALALSAKTIRIQAPVPGKGYIGIEVPNEEISLVALRDILESQALKRLKSPLRFALGQNVAGNAVAADLAGMPHLLVAGATGSGKSVCVNALICCLLMNNTPDDLRLVMVDPKRVELTGYNGIPHLLAPVVVELENVVSALQWILREMDMRYKKLAEAGTRNIKEYNSQVVAAQKGDQKNTKLPYLVVIIDELADLMMLAPDETERSITRLAQLARATGIHMVIATQRPSVDVVTGLIKANFPARIAFAVASNTDSRVILDQPGAERLLGRGDMLFQAPDAPAPVRLQGVFVSDNEIYSLVNYWRAQAGVDSPSPSMAGGIVGIKKSNISLKQTSFWDNDKPDEPEDPLYPEAVDLVRRQGRASISMLQRRLRIGYTRAARLIEEMEEKDIVGPPDPNTGTREVLDYGPAAPPTDDP